MEGADKLNSYSGHAGKAKYFCTKGTELASMQLLHPMDLGWTPDGALCVAVKVFLRGE